VIGARRRELFQQHGNRLGEGHAWDSLGYSHHHLGQRTQATKCYQRALTLIRSLGDRYNEAVVLDHTGDNHYAAGSITAARAAYQETLDIFSELGHCDATTARAQLDNLDRSRRSPNAAPTSPS
jgi:tetratricopeptide (TPR) repeat protein